MGLDARLTDKARAAGRAALQARTRERALDLAQTIQELRAAGNESLRAIASGMDQRDIPAARGGKWSAVQVARLIEAGTLTLPRSTYVCVPKRGLGRDGHADLSPEGRLR
jgi:hypothetical protein